MTPSRPTLRERQWQVRDEAILEAAHDLLHQQGYAEMNMDDLASQVGISKATLYHHFASKEDLVISVIVRAIRANEEHLRASEPGISAIARLETMLRRAFERRTSFTLTGATLAPERVREHPRYQEQRLRMISIVTELIEEAQNAGDLDPQLSAAVVAPALLRLIQIDFSDLVNSGICTPATLSDTLVTMLLNGIRVDQRSTL